MSRAQNELRARNLRTLGALAGLFFLPLAISFWMYYGTDWRPARQVNHGELISPVRTLPRSNLPLVAGTTPMELFKHKWSLVYIGNGRCDEACRHALYIMRQTRLSLNNEMTRVERIFLATGDPAAADCCDRELVAHEHPGLIVLDARGTAATALLQGFPAERARSLFIVDPLGNLMMSYDTQRDPKGLLEDLKKLLTLSHIG
jgi:hypothetical protein